MLTCLCNPQTIEPEDFNLSTKEGRQSLLKDLEKKKVRTLYLVSLKTKKSATQYRLCETGPVGNKDGYMFLKNDVDNDICYVVRFKPNISSALKKIVGSTITQVGVWRNEENPGPSTSITKDVFFDRLLPKTGVIASDFQQTDLGRKFWIRRITDAWSQNLNVYFVHPDKKRVVLLTPETFNSMKEAGDLWGTDAKYKQRFLVITGNDIPESE